MAITYEPIATTTLSTATASVTFSSISGYTDLFIVCDFVLTSSGDSLGLQFNSDTGSNYSDTMIVGNGSAASSNRQTSNTYIRNGYWEAGRSQTNVSIMNYANSTTYKTTLARQFQSGTTTSYVVSNVGLWRNTNAITSVTLDAVSGNIDTGSIFSIYGIKAA
jgi:hypothetical protein